MPTAKHFDQCPEFPSDVAVADVPVISYDLIHQSDGKTSSQLFEALQQYGFFVLNLDTCDEGRALIRDAEAMFDLTKETFDLDRELLEQYPIQLPKSVYGYKSTGKLATDDGYKDAVETFMYSQDDVLGNTVPPMPKPHTVVGRLQQCQSFCINAHKVVSTILDRLDNMLGLPLGKLSSLCPIDKPSATGVRMLRAAPSSLHEKQTVSGGAHTDIGVLTLVFNVVGGLQIRPVETLDDEKEPWKFIQPRQGCVVVNAGDTLVEWTGGIIRSNLHRVHRPPGKQADVVRLSVAYPLRPSHDGSMRRLKGSHVIPALATGEKDETRSPDEWAAWKAQQIREGQFKPQSLGGIMVAQATPQAVM